MDILKDHISTGFFFIFLSIFVINRMEIVDAECHLPENLRNSDWEYKYTQVSDNSEQSKILTISTTTLQNSVINLNAFGTTIDDWTCINSLTISSTEGVMVFKSDTSFTDGGLTSGNRLYLCMKFTEVTSDLYYFYLLSDIYTDVNPNERVFVSTNTADDASICNTFCQYTETPKIRTLRKSGTSDSLPSSTPLCECGSSCSSRAYSIGFNKTWTIVFVAIGLVFNSHNR
ncbi:uncharacterized protein LOC127714528 [Mytilus californianus]|uniref:uncharacterized protein LOC127714528 n=1 Tax=Mytilus californianus TaxID=6549 RepID=UPI002247F294|nr:uncharacterized protein LOC127714528 [Mytilus californianus]